MPRPLLISLKDGRDLKPYGVKKVHLNMKFSFIICVVIVFVGCDGVRADTRVMNDLKYLEFLNDLDRRNVELEYDLHRQWPFYVTAGNRVREEKDEEVDTTQLEEPDDPENLKKIEELVNMARAEMVNRHHQNYHGSLLDRIENGYKHLKDTTDRANQLSQYLRYKTPSTHEERLEEARMYPPEDDFSFNEEEEDEEQQQQEEEDNDTNFFRSDNDFDLENEEDQTEIEPAVPQYYQRLKPIVIGAPRERLPLSIGEHVENHEDDHEEEHSDHNHEDYKFKEGEEFPQTISFNEVPMAEDPGEFAVGPSDPRFYRDAIRPGNIVMVTNKPLYNEINIPKSYPTKKPKEAFKTNALKQTERNAENEEISSAQTANREVEVVPFKPSDLPADSAGVYIIAVVAGISAAATVGLIAVGIGWYNLQKHMKNAEDTDYPSYGITGPNKDYEKKDRDEAGDRRLAQSAQMYHYQHQKQQIIAMGRNPQGHGSQSDTEEEEDEEGNYTVYECPGLASIEGPLEVKNPMFDDDQLATPSLTPSKPTNAEDTK